MELRLEKTEFLLDPVTGLDDGELDWRLSGLVWSLKLQAEDSVKLDTHPPLGGATSGRQRHLASAMETLPGEQ